jgi:RNA polymerase sigma factor FliA
LGKAANKEFFSYMIEQNLQLSNVERDKLVESNLNYVRALAGKIMRNLPSSVDFEELVGYGTIGLIESAERFDPLRGVSFTTFSHYRIKGAIFDGLRQMGYYNHQNNKRAVWEANANDLLQTASDDADHTEMNSGSVEDEIASVENLLEGLIPVYLISLDAEETNEIADSSLPISASVETRQLLAVIMEVVAELSPEEQQLIKDIYVKQIPMVKIAEKRGSNKSWISRLHARAIKRVQDKLRIRGLLEKKT